MDGKERPGVAAGNIISSILNICAFEKSFGRCRRSLRSFPYLAQARDPPSLQYI